MRSIQFETVSVIVPTYNDTDDLAGCLEALDRQTVRDKLEIVVSIDGHEHIPEYVADRADIIVEGSHCGPAAARNRGWKASSGDPVLFTDSDCIPDTEWAEKMMGILQQRADAVKGVYTEGGNRVIQRLAQIEFNERYKLLSSHETIDMIDTYSAGYRRDVLEETGGFDESFPFPNHEDVDLSYKIVAKGYRLLFEPAAKVSHRHRDTWRAYFRMKFSRGRWRMNILRRYPGKAGSDTYTPKCLKIQIILCPFLLPAAALIALTGLPLAIWGGIFLISTIPLAIVALADDKSLVPVVPFFIFWRACALFSGMCRGIFASREVNE